MLDDDSTNLSSIALFTQDLIKYESQVQPGSQMPHDYVRPGQFVRSALLRLVTAQPADVYVMMRTLVEHIQTGIHSTYGEFPILMLANSLRDETAYRLIMSILYTTRSLLVGDKVDLNASWFVLVDRNLAIQTFLQNYSKSDQALIEETYSGNVVVGVKETISVSSPDPKHSLLIGYDNYHLTLTGSYLQTISFALDQAVEPDPTAQADVPLVLECEVLVSPVSGQFALDSAIQFYDDAIAQTQALNAVVGGYTAGQVSVIELPDIFYSAILTIITPDGGKSWWVADFQVAPPSLL